MINQDFKPQLPHRYARYGRMSDPGQNERSPEQQFDTIDAVVRRLRYPWQHVADYRDDGISGRLFRKRKGLQKLLRDIMAGLLVIDLILVDTLERFGRADQIRHTRQMLYEKRGVLIVTANTNFADPLSASGRALGDFEATRSVEDGRIKAHMVLRGKRDAVKLGHWPGGPIPLGMMLKSILTMRRGVEEVDHKVLIPDPATGWIITMLFQKAFDSGWGSTRLARWLNEHPDIPAEFKPFQSATVGYWLKSKLYCGELVWEQHSTDICDDARVIKRNPDSEVVSYPNFCEPLTTPEIWGVVNQRREQRGERIRHARAVKDASTGKQIAPIAPGMVVNYPLTGLVRCAHCGAAMRASSSRIYTTAAGEPRRYVNYVCPGHSTGACPNGTSVPEEWLRGVVIETLRKRLFPESL